MRRFTLTPEDEARMIALYDSGLSCDDVGEKMGISGSRIGKWLNARGLTRTPGATIAMKMAQRGTVRTSRPRVPKNAPRCKTCHIVLSEGETELCTVCRAEERAGIVYTGEDFPTPLARAEDISGIVAMLDLPEGSRVVWKSPMMLTGWTAQAVCQYCRLMIWLGDNRFADEIDGATFCPGCEGNCETAPGACRERAFVAFVAERVQEASVRAKQDKPVAAARYRMEKAGETFDREVRI